MPQSTLLQQIQVPSTSDTPTIPAHILSAIQAVEERSLMRFDTTAARDATITVPLSGMLSWIRTTKVVYVYDGTAWVPLVSLLQSITIQAVDSLNSGGQMTLAGAGANKSWRLKSSTQALTFVFDPTGTPLTPLTLASTSLTLGTGVTFVREGVNQPVLRSGPTAPSNAVGNDGDWYAVTT